MPGVDPCRNRGCGGVMRASCGEPIGCGVLAALCIALAPFAIWAYPGEGSCWSIACGCGEEVTCWLRPDDVREGIWRIARLLGDCSIDGDGRAGCDWGAGVPAGESDGDNSELISMMRRGVALSGSCAANSRYRPTTERRIAKLHVRLVLVLRSRT